MKLLKQTFKNWGRHTTSVYADALTYIFLIGFPPILLAVFFALKVFFEKQGLMEDLLATLRSVVPGEAFSMIEGIATTEMPAPHIGAVVLTVLLLLWAGSKMISIFEIVLNEIFEVRISEKKKTLMLTVRRKVMNMLSIVVAIVVVLAYLLTNQFIGYFFDFGMLNQVVVVISGVFFIACALFFSLKTMLYVNFKNGVTFVASLVSAVVLMGAMGILPWVLSFVNVGDGFQVGAAVLIFMVWVNFLMKVLLLCAEATHVFLYSKDAVFLKPYAAKVVETHRGHKVPFMDKLKGLLKRKGKK